ncbi:MAG: sensor histidine kinase [Collinsella sp.]
MTVDLNRLILGKSYNSTKVFRTAQHVVQAILLGIVVPLLILLLIWDLTDNPNPVPAVVVIAGLVMLCFFFSYVFVVPDDLTSSATDRTLAIASKIFAYTSRGLTPEAALGASKIILSETIASAICFTDGKQVLASWGEDSAKCPAGTPVVLRTTLNVINSGEQSVFSRDASTETGGYFPRLRAGIVAPLTVRGHCVGTLELYYPRLSSIDMRQTALASGFADLISTQLASFELERQDELKARVELRALQSQVDPHFLFNTISTIVSLVRTEPDKARSLLIDFSNYYRQTLSDSDTLTTLERETEPLSIHVRAFETDDGLEIIVEDDGIGMSEEVCAHLFEQHRLEEPESITADGSVKRGCGLALFNVLQRIHFFYGEDSGMRVKSQEGVGTQVIVELNGEPHEPAPLTA